MEPTDGMHSETGLAGTSSTSYRAVVWLDNQEARITFVRVDEAGQQAVRRAGPPRQLHIKSDSGQAQRPTSEPEFYYHVAKACDEARTVMLVGTATAKQEFVEYLYRHSPRICGLIAEIPSMHP